ncbi:MAG: hypothetical protein QM708_07535 [Propioniciclava sp.]|uniref:hypothetical protein n=1 Tax=Propioniciclava sp. TaxID=2038686 RepID=UPI0039E2D88E
MIAALDAEFRKLVTLPAVWLAVALTIGLPPALASANAAMLRRALDTGRLDGLLSTSTVDEGFGQLTLGIVGVIVLAVVAVSSEYTRSGQHSGGSRQLLSTMVAMPRRGQVIAAKIVAVTACTAVMAAITIPLTVTVSRAGLGRYASAFPDMLSRSVGVTAYWVCMALLALGLTALTRNGVVPMVLLITNASMISFSLLASRVTDFAKYLPDLAAYPSFISEHPMTHPLEPSAGLVVLAIWGAAAVAATAISYIIRDA